MSTKLISIVAAVIVVLVGAGLFVVNNKSSDDDNGNQNTSEQADSSSPEFSATNPFDQSFVATISGTADGNSFEGLLEADSEGNGKFSSSQNGSTVEIYFTPDSTISCSDGTCFRTPTNGSSPFNIQQYTYSDDDFQEFKDSATYEGQQDCPAGRCDVWKVNDDTENVETRIFLSTSDQRISQVVGVQNGETTTIVYEFKDVTINLPENVQEIPTQ